MIIPTTGLLGRDLMVSGLLVRERREQNGNRDRLCRVEMLLSSLSCHVHDLEMEALCATLGLNGMQ